MQQLQSKGRDSVKELLPTRASFIATSALGILGVITPGVVIIHNNNFSQ